MEPRFKEMKATDVMLYDQSGVLQIHYKSGVFRRPHKAVVKEKVARAGTVNKESAKRLKSGYAWRTEKPAGEGAEEAAESEEEVDPWAEDDLEDETTDEDDDW